MQVRVEAGTVYVRGKKTALRNGKRVPAMVPPSREDTRVFLIVGAGPAGQVRCVVVGVLDCVE
jgi:hypothetical protein